MKTLVLIGKSKRANTIRRRLEIEMPNNDLQIRQFLFDEPIPEELIVNDMLVIVFPNYKLPEIATWLIQNKKVLEINAPLYLDVSETAMFKLGKEISEFFNGRLESKLDKDLLAEVKELLIGTVKDNYGYM